MSRIRFIALTALAVSGSGCTSLRALDQAATDLANQTPTCTQEPAVGVDNYGGKTCTITHTVRSSTTTTVEETGKEPVTTRTVTTPSGTTTEIVPTP
ncbi:MAG: hypothetical protein U1C74_21745 [Phenylobacterium sp.]|jgi:hypothetical protein|uniref:Uncharacterized protein n=1 Tax=Brevundimonas mediterranea TaxID=74329 RepID=A0AB37E842_9CAUL|nr:MULTISPECIES: hypothetical protein [Brevundimonas]MDZ4317684.1 hypothetical protein [Phenylobacterium sp.]OYX80162.1 MAG: hypothetical protein B7Y85_06360 [Brevundimonas sp. 32-68-21]PZO00638.1 MAG: hypothetical protein DCF29_16730 [Alphaproteobacteria bacterium]TAJ44358.1 MAG: hypothetical protein EPO54_07145 [Brevundimonas sp.]EDX79433.1 hypothetical protein BBAL3_590 [Brevundimonas sp. BAL3]